jgi:uncharacterized protein with PQ loop repeat
VVIGLVADRAKGTTAFRVPATLVTIIAVLTQLIYPYFYNSLLSLNPVMLITLSTRNLLLFVLLGWTLETLFRLRASALPKINE